MGNSRRGLGVIRVSTKKQRAGTSPDTQREGIQKYAAEVGIDLVDIVEFHESAMDSTQRRKFHAALEAMRQNRTRHMVFWVLDRVARNLTDHEMMEREARADNIVIHIAVERKPLWHGSPAADWLAADFNAVTNKQYSRDLQRRGEESTDKKARDGWYPARAPIGYVNTRAVGPDGEILKGPTGRIKLTESGRQLIRRMYDLRLEGHSLLAIAETVLAENLVPAKKRWGFKGAGAAERVRDILMNPFYKGQFWWRGALYDGKHTPVLSSREWDALQSTFGKRGSGRRRKHTGTFTGFLRCAECGCAIVFDPKEKPSGKRYLYYVCSNMKRQHRKRPRITEAKLFAQFEQVLDAIELSEDRAKKIAEALNEVERQARAAHREQADYFKARLTELRQREDELYPDLKAGILDEAGYRRQRDLIRQEMDRCTDNLTETQAGITDVCLITAQRLIELARDAKTLWVSRAPAERRALLEEVVSNPVLDQQTVRYDLKKPFRVLVENSENEEWRARQDSNL